MEKKAVEQLNQIGKIFETREKEKKKILILSLGTGSILGIDSTKMTPEEKKEKLAQREYSYRTAEYYFEGGGDKIKTEYVAEPLMKKFSPDEVFIVGTSKSSWTGFYGKFGDENEEKGEIISQLFDLEENGGKDLEQKDIEEYTQKIGQFYNKGMCHGIFSGVKIHVIVTYYGINRNELLDNYCLLRDAIGKALNNGQYRYEVAFDITHSFRSMPVYNLVVLNYLQNILQIDLDITHIYYGNLEISSENNGLSPIVNLEELIGVLKLSNSVSEFKNTGNAVSLIKGITDKEKKLKDALEAFDWATQINNYDEIIKGLKRIIELSIPGDCVQSGKYADLQEMILNVIWSKFFAGEVGADNTNIAEQLLNKLNGMSKAEIQYCLSKWYYNQNRYGEALATGLEALRSYLVSLYLVRNTDSDPENENSRKAAVEHLKRFVENEKSGKIIWTDDNEERNKVTEVIRELEECMKDITLIRNTFAHNLGGQSDNAGNTSAGGNDPREQIRRFFGVFDRFVELMQTDKETVEEIYWKEPVKPEQKSVNGEDCRLIIASADDQPDKYEEYRVSAQGKKYKVYTLAPDILTYLDQNKKSCKQLKDSAIFLAEYVKKQADELDKMHIILYRLTLDQQIHYMQVLKCIGILHFFDENRREDKLPKLAFDMSGDAYKNFNREWFDKNQNNNRVHELMNKTFIRKV